jgi:hypothetical protein
MKGGAAAGSAPRTAVGFTSPSRASLHPIQRLALRWEVCEGLADLRSHKLILSEVGGAP